MSTTLPNMALQVPATGDSDYPTSISTSLTNIDNHDHTTGKGLPIHTGGLADGAVTGVKLAAAVVDNSTIEKVSNQLRVKDLGITRAKLAAVGQQVSASCGGFVTQSLSYVDVTNLSVSITTTGRPVVLALVGDGAGSSFIRLDYVGAGTTAIVSGSVKILRGVTDISIKSLALEKATAESELKIVIPGDMIHIDPVAAGTYTYKLQAIVFEPDTQLAVAQMKLIAYEL